MKNTKFVLHGLLRYPCGEGSLVVGRDLHFMAPSNDIYYEPSLLRKQLDKNGYLYFRSMIPQESLHRIDRISQKHLSSLGYQSHNNRTPDTRFQRSSENSEENEKIIMDVACGTKVMSIVHQIFGAQVKRYDYVSLDASPKGERHGFHMDSVFMNKGTKLFLSVWVPLSDLTLSNGPIVLLHSSNADPNSESLRFSYGKYDAYSRAVEGNGIYSYNPCDVKKFGKGMVTASFCRGDIVVLGGYTMRGYLTNSLNQARLSVESKWCLQDDDLGPDPGYTGHEMPETNNRPSMTLAEARKTIWNVSKK